MSKEQELLDLLNMVVKTSDKVLFSDINKVLFSSPELIELENKYPKLGIKQTGVVTLASLLATITDVLINKRLAFQVEDNFDNSIVGFAFITTYSKSFYFYPVESKHLLFLIPEAYIELLDDPNFKISNDLILAIQNKTKVIGLYKNIPVLVTNNIPKTNPIYSYNDLTKELDSYIKIYLDDKDSFDKIETISAPYMPILKTDANKEYQFAFLVANKNFIIIPEAYSELEADPDFNVNSAFPYFRKEDVPFLYGIYDGLPVVVSDTMPRLSCRASSYADFKLELDWYNQKKVFDSLSVVESLHLDDPLIPYKPKPFKLFWELVHNFIAHPLLGITFNATWASKFHDYTADRF